MAGAPSRLPRPPEVRTVTPCARDSRDCPPAAVTAGPIDGDSSASSPRVGVVGGAGGRRSRVPGVTAPRKRARHASPPPGGTLAPALAGGRAMVARHTVARTKRVRSLSPPPLPRSRQRVSVSPVHGAAPCPWDGGRAVLPRPRRGGSKRARPAAFNTPTPGAVRRLRTTSCTTTPPTDEPPPPLRRRLGTWSPGADAAAAGTPPTLPRSGGPGCAVPPALASVPSSPSGR